MSETTIFRTAQPATTKRQDMYLEDHLVLVRNDPTGWQQVKACTEIIPQFWDVIELERCLKISKGAYSFKGCVAGAYGHPITISAFLVACYLTNVPLKHVYGFCWRVGLTRKPLNSKKTEYTRMEGDSSKKTLSVFYATVQVSTKGFK